MNFSMQTKGRYMPLLNEYKIVLEPGQDMINRLEEALENQNIFLAETGIEIILGTFHAKEELENTLIRWIQKICNLRGRFLITLNNFSGKPPHNIHLRIQNPEEIKKMINQFYMIDQFIQSNDCPPAVLSYSPQLNLMNNIPENHFSKVLNEFSGKDFHESFIAEKIKLYKKINTGMPFQLVYAFSLPEDAKY